MKSFIRIVFCFVLFVSKPLIAVSQTDPIDSTLQQCLDQHTASYDMIMCMDDAASAWDAALNDVYKKLMLVLTPEEQKLLRESQRAWIVYRDSEMAFYELYENNPGSGADFNKRRREMELNRTRTLELRSYYGDYSP